jgi:hypothetical protein
MVALDVYSLRDVFDMRGILICFNGPFSHSIIEELGKAIRNYLENDESPKSRVTDVFAIFVEQAQNLKNYTEKWRSSPLQPKGCMNGTLVISREEEHYVVSSGNLIAKEDASDLTGRLASIGRLDAIGLKSAYKERLRGSAKPSGAGLGLIDMARRASAPLGYSFKELADGTSFFSISALV